MTAWDGSAKLAVVASSLFEASERPMAIADVSTAIFEGEAVLYHPATRMVHRLNGISSGVWLLSDGDTSVATMSAELAELFAVDADTLDGAVHDSLALLAEAGLLVGHEHPPEDFITSVDDYASDDSRIIPRPDDP